jgi:hypothetical protein
LAKPIFVTPAELMNHQVSGLVEIDGPSQSAQALVDISFGFVQVHQDKFSKISKPRR